MPILFCNIAWMTNYDGRTKKDKPLGGGEFPRLEGYCGEECNFVKCEDGYVYGYFETFKGELDRNVLIERLGATRSDDFIDGIDIVWTAPWEGNDPRVVVGWWRNARLYRGRQHYNGHFPSPQHRKDEITSFRVKARIEDVVLLPPARRTSELKRGRGWSGQTSWWYAEDSTNPDARKFVAGVKALMDGNSFSPLSIPTGSGASGGKGRTGAAASKAYRRYVREFEGRVHPRHDKLEKRFKAFLRQRHRQIDFPRPFRDDLRYAIPGEPEVMVEVKPTDVTTVRFAIRTAIGQLLDYKQHQQWSGLQLVVVETEVRNADDLRLAFDNGFGVAWPDKSKGFRICWPERS
jgi:hypothetical protein